MSTADIKRHLDMTDRVPWVEWMGPVNGRTILAYSRTASRPPVKFDGNQYCFTINEAQK